MESFSTFVLISFSLLFTPLFGARQDNVLDISYPIVIKEVHDGTDFSKSYFGYSVSLSQSLDRIGHPKGWVFIGAPKFNFSAFKYDATDFEPGILWRCSLGSPSPSGDSCEQMNVDPYPKNKARPQPGNPSRESHSSAFIGVASEVNHDRLVTCGHNWKRGNNKFYNGICYWFAHDSSKTSYRSEKLTDLFDQRSYDQRLMPFFTLDKDDERLFEFVNATGGRQVGQEWQQGQAGMSVHLFQDGNQNPNLLVGAVGVREWSGAVVLYTNEDDPSSNNRCKYCERLNRNKRNPTFSKFHVFNRGNIPTKDNIPKEKLWSEYFGYSVSSGRYLNKNEVLYASGAPRGDDGRGAVEVFYGSGGQKTGNKSQIISRLRLTPPGNMLAFGSYFGSAIHSVDLDGDGLDELIVGAPMYSYEASGGNSSREIPDKGAVFIYNFKDFGRNTTVSHKQALDGSKVVKAKFGSALSSFSLNLNGTREVYLVVGAPFEVKGQSSGAIYLYLFDITRTKLVLSARIAASQIESGIYGFGSSISIGVDIDMNQTPDLAIGAFKSGHTVVLRTRPRIELKGYLQFSNKNSADSSQVDKVLRGSNNFYVISCFKLKQSFGTVKDAVRIWTRLKILDRNVKFGTVSTPNKEKSDNMILFYKSGVYAGDGDTCEPIEIVSAFGHGIGMDDSDVIIENAFLFNFTQEVWYNDTASTRTRPLKIQTEGYPSRSENTRFEDFNSDWPSPRTYFTHNSIQVTHCKQACRPNLVMNFKFYNPGALNDSITEFVLGSPTKEVVLMLDVENMGDFAEKMKIQFKWDNTMITESISGNRWLHSNCQNRTTSSSRFFEDCSMPLYIRHGRKTTIPLHFNMENVFALEPMQLEFRVTARISFFGDNPTKSVENSGKLILKTPETKVSVAGSTGNEILLDSDDSDNRLMRSFRQRYTIQVCGGPVKELKMDVKLPVAWTDYEKNTRHIFEVAHPKSAVVDMDCTTEGKFKFLKVDHAAVHARHSGPEALTQGNGTESLEENSPQNVPRTEISQDSFCRVLEKSKPVTVPADSEKLECNFDNCMDISCVLKNVKANIPIHIHFDTFPIKKRTEELISATQMSTLFVKSEASVQIFDAFNNTNYKDSDIGSVVLTKQIGRSKQGLVIAIVSSILGSIVVLIIISAVLYKCGFFKREKRQQLNQMKEEHRRKSMIALRASMLQNLSSDITDDSRMSLTLSEHQNEDTFVTPPPSESPRKSSKEIAEVSL